MNPENLNKLIKQYEDNLDRLYGSEHYELFKWQAMKTWQDEWFRPEDAFPTFADRYAAATKDFSLFIDNSRMHPSNGVIKLWEKDPAAVESLFRDVLFADAHGDIAAIQSNMDNFLNGYEALRQKHFPKNWSYKQDRHSASVYLAMNDPGLNYVFKSSEAHLMAKYTSFGFEIGSGARFSLPNYYRLCDDIVNALREHESLLDKHFGKLKPLHYRDESLHLLAFDLMYCSRTYGFYKILTDPRTSPKRKRSGSQGEHTEEQIKFEAEHTAQIEAIELEIAELERRCDEYSEISLIDVQVTSPAFGVGTVIEQDINKIKVRFGSFDKSFILDGRYPSRPRFEDDDAIIEAFTEYGRIQDEIKRLKTKLVLHNNNQ